MRKLSNGNRLVRTLSALGFYVFTSLFAGEVHEDCQERIFEKDRLAEKFESTGFPSLAEYYRNNRRLENVVNAIENSIFYFTPGQKN